MGKSVSSLPPMLLWKQAGEEVEAEEEDAGEVEEVVVEEAWVVLVLEIFFDYGILSPIRQM